MADDYHERVTATDMKLTSNKFLSFPSFLSTNLKCVSSGEQLVFYLLNMYRKEGLAENLHIMRHQPPFAWTLHDRFILGVKEGHM